MAAELAVRPSDGRAKLSSTVRKAVQVLDALAGSPADLGARDLAERTGLDRTTVYRLLLLMMPRAILQSAGALFAGNLAGKGYTWYHPGSTVVGIVTALGFDFLLIPHYHVYGAAVVLNLSYLASLIVLIFGFCRVNEISTDEFLTHSFGFWTGAIRAVQRFHPVAASSAK